VVQPSGKATRVRSVQNHSRDVEAGLPGSRVALNLPDLAVDAGHAAATEAAVGRGDVVSLAEFGGPSDTLDVLLERSTRVANSDDPGAARPLKDGTVVHVHHGSGDFAAKVALLEGKDLPPGAKALVQLRFETPVYAFAGDRLIVRDWRAQHTLAGGVVLDPDARRRGFRDAERRAFLEARAAATRNPSPAAQVLPIVATELARSGAAKRSALLAKSRFSASEVAEAVAKLVADGRAVIAGDAAVDAPRWHALRERAGAAVDSLHKAHPDQPGMKLTDLRQALEAKAPLPSAGVFDALVADLERSGFVRAGAAIRRLAHRPALPPHLKIAGDRIRAALGAKPFEPPARKELARDPASQQALRFLLNTGEAVDVGEDLTMLGEHLRRAVEVISDSIRKDGPATVSELRQLLGTNRRVIVPLVEYLDKTGVTVRKGDERVLREPAGQASR
jgi:selenocysteine-specific elongation factor